MISTVRELHPAEGSPMFKILRYPKRWWPNPCFGHWILLNLVESGWIMFRFTNMLTHLLGWFWQAPKAEAERLKERRDSASTQRGTGCLQVRKSIPNAWNIKILLRSILQVVPTDIHAKIWRLLDATGPSSKWNKQDPRTWLVWSYNNHII